VFGFSKLDVMFGRSEAAAVRHAYRDIVKPGVTFVQTTVRSIDPLAKRVETDAGVFESDILVVALGADLDPAATPGLDEAGQDFYSVDGAFAAREVLANFAGGRVIVGVLSTPYKCPPAPSETALMLHDFLSKRGLRDRSQIDLVVDFGRPVPPSPDASTLLEGAFADRGIGWHPKQQVSALDASSATATLRDGGELPFDLFLAVPVHRAPAVVLESGMAVDGWIPVNPLTLETSSEGVYAVGDVAAVGTPRAGVFAEGQAAVAAAHIAATIKGASSDGSTAAAASATSRWAMGRSRSSTSPSSATSGSTTWWAPQLPTRPTRPSSARAGSSAGSGATGRPPDRARRSIQTSADLGL